MMIPGRLILPHQVKPVLLFQSLIDESPGTILFFIDFALAIIGATAGTIDQPLVAGSDRTDTGSFAEKTLTALGASLTKVARTLFHGYEKSIHCRNNWFAYVQVHPANARQHEGPHAQAAVANQPGR